MELTNFRDLGGLVGFEGKKIKEKMILRAGEPVGLCEADVKELREVYQLAHLIDFRGEKEIDEKPVDTIEGVAYQNIDIMASEMKKQHAPSLEEMINQLESGSSDKFMNQAYVNFVISDDAKIGYRAFIDSLLHAKGALLFHCMAGKDRTGWGAVIILKMLGVSDEDIMIDYLATIEGRKAANEAMITSFREKGLSEEKLDVFKEMMSVKASFLEAALNTVKEVYGTFDNYLRTALNVTDEEIDQLRHFYLA